MDLIVIVSCGKQEELFPKFKDTKVYAAVAALHYEHDADQYTAEQGLYVIRVSDNDVFTPDAAKKENQRFFNGEWELDAIVRFRPLSPLTPTPSFRI